MNESVPAEPPEAVVRRVFAALTAGNWQLVAESAHEETLERFRRWELCLLQARTGTRPPTPFELDEVRPGTPGAVLDWILDQEAAALARDREGWPSGLLGVNGVEELAPLPACRVFQALARGVVRRSDSLAGAAKGPARPEPHRPWMCP